MKQQEYQLGDLLLALTIFVTLLATSGGHILGV